MSHDVVIYVTNWPVVLGIGVGLVSSAVLASHYVVRSLRGKTMKQERRQFLENELTDEITEVIEDGIIDNRWSREEANEFYLKLKKCFPIHNLFPSVEPLKERIHNRLKSHTHAPVELPDRVEPEIEKPKRKHMLSK